MAGRTVQIRIGGQNHRVTTSAGDEELARLVAAVEQKLALVVGPGRAVTPQAMLLAAMALAYDLEASQKRADSLATLARGSVDRILRRVDTVLSATADGGAAPGAR